MEISNKTLAWFVIGAIVISLAGSMFSLTNSRSITGYAIGDTSNTSGEARVDVSQSVTLRYAAGRNSTNFGAGEINTSGSFNNCTLAVDDSTTVYKTGCVGFANTNEGPLILENAGTSYLSVTLNFTSNASTFIGGNDTVRSLKFKVADQEGSSCITGLSPTTWTEIGTPNTTVAVCSNLSWISETNSIRIGLNMTIPTDTPSGERSITIIAQGTSI
jgi:hypothetical protein